MNVLISAYNGKKYIDAQMESILKQEKADVHICVRDDGSTDGTAEYIKGRYPEDRVTVVSGENVGHGRSFYQLVQMAETGDYWAFSDQDDVWLPEKLRMAVEWMEAQSQDDPQMPLLFHSAYECRNEDLTQVLYTCLPPKEAADGSIPFYKGVADSVFQGFSIVFNAPLRELFLQAPEEEVSSHDWLMGMIALSFGKTKYDATIASYHRRMADSQSGMDLGNRLNWLGKTWMHPDQSDIRRTAKVFVKTFEERLSVGSASQQQNIRIAKWFCKGYSIHTLQKLFYPHRWRPSLSSEAVLRFLILCGKI